MSQSCQFWSLCSFELSISDILNVELIWLVCYILVAWSVERWRCYDFFKRPNTYFNLSTTHSLNTFVLESSLCLAGV